MQIVINSKARVFGECINSWELLVALHNDVFNDDDAPIQVSTQYHSELLKMVYVCPDCNRLHLVAGELDTTSYCHLIPKVGMYIDHNNDGKYVTKKELSGVLQQLENALNISLQNAGDDKSYTLTKVFKCSPDCPVIHLDSAYERECLDLN